jgi:phosphinothricin acetyltransferase
MGYSLEEMNADHRREVIDNFNYYITQTLAAFPDEPVSYDFFDRFLELSSGYPAVVVKAETGEVVGFGFLRAYHSARTFARTAEIAYFIRPEHTRQGLGTAMLEHLMKRARKQGIDSLLASIYCHNEASVSFHQKNGFRQCGRLLRAGRKFDQDLDVVWMQKHLA